MKIAIVGAGAIGRGLLAPMFCRAGHAVTFIEREDRIARPLAQSGYYPIRQRLGDDIHWIGPVTATLRRTETERALDQADIIFVAVRKENLSEVSAMLVPTNVPIFICENTPNAVGELERHCALDLWFINAIAECVIPEMPPEIQEIDPVLTYADPKGYLVIDANAYPNKSLDAIKGIVLEDDFALAWDLKWYCHCALHLMTACLGLQAGFEFIHDAIADRKVHHLLWMVMAIAQLRLEEKYPNRDMKIGQRIDSEFSQLGDAARPDTCARVSRDLKRKLEKGERLQGLRALIVRDSSALEIVDSVIRYAEELVAKQQDRQNKR